MELTIAELRRVRLKELMVGRAIPTKDKSYFSQIFSGKTSFGEKAARRIEREYLMPEGSLDKPIETEIDMDRSAENRKCIIAHLTTRLENIPYEKLRAVAIILDVTI